MVINLHLADVAALRTALCWGWLTAGLLGAGAAPALPRVTELETAANTAPLMGGGFSLTPPLVEAPIQHVRFPPEAKVREIHAMAAGGGRLWLAARGTDRVSVRSADPALARNFEPAEIEAVRLWSMALSGGAPQRVSGPLATNQIHDLAIIGDELWCVTDGTGLAALRMEDGQVRRFFGEPELEPVNARLVVGTTNRIFVLSDQLRVSEDQGASWRILPVPELGQPAAQKTDHDRLLVSGDRLMLLSGAALEFDPGKRRWMRQDEILTPRAGGFLPQAGTGDGQGGFWLSGAGGVAEIRAPNQAPRLLAVESPLEMQLAEGVGIAPTPLQTLGRTRKVPGGWEPHLQALLSRRETAAAVGFGRLPGAVSGLAAEGDWVWLTTGDSRRSLLLLFQRQERQWVAGVSLPYNPPKHVLVTGDTVWLGGFGHETQSPLVRLRRAPLVAIPMDRWVPETATPDEWIRGLDAQPTASKAMAWLLAGQPGEVSKFWGEEDEEDLQPEQLFFLSLAFDEFGMKQPERSQRLRERLLREYAGSIYALVLGNRRRTPAAGGQLAAPATAEVETLPDRRWKRFDLEQSVAGIPAEARALVAAYDRNADQKLDRTEMTALFEKEPRRIPFYREKTADARTRVFFFLARYLHPVTEANDADRLAKGLEKLARDQASGAAPRLPEP